MKTLGAVPRTEPGVGRCTAVCLRCPQQPFGSDSSDPANEHSPSSANTMFPSDVWYLLSQRFPCHLDSAADHPDVGTQTCAGQPGRLINTGSMCTEGKPAVNVVDGLDVELPVSGDEEVSGDDQGRVCDADCVVQPGAGGLLEEP